MSKQIYDTRDIPGTPIAIDVPVRRLVDLTEDVCTYYENPPPVVEYVVEPLIPRGEITILVGDAGTGKTHLAIALLCAAYQGSTWLGCPVEKQNRIVYIDVESGLDTVRAYLRSYDAERPQPDWASSVLYDNIAPGTFTAQTFEELMRAAGAVRGGNALAILDNLSDLAMTGDVNALHHVTALLRPIAQVCHDNGWTLLCLDYPAKHQGSIVGNEEEQKRGTPYGAASKIWIARSVLQIVLHSKSENNGVARVHCTLRHVKSNYRTAPEIPYTLVFHGNQWRIELGATEEHGLLGRVLEVVAENPYITAGEIAEQLGKPTRTVRAYLRRLQSQGLLAAEEVREEGKGRPSKRWKYNNTANGL